MTGRPVTESTGRPVTGRPVTGRPVKLQFIHAKIFGGSQNSSSASRDNSRPTREPSIVCVVYLKTIFKRLGLF